MPFKSLKSFCAASISECGDLSPLFHRATCRQARRNKSRYVFSAEEKVPERGVYAASTHDCQRAPDCSNALLLFTLKRREREWPILKHTIFYGCRYADRALLLGDTTSVDAPTVRISWDGASAVAARSALAAPAPHRPLGSVAIRRATPCVAIWCAPAEAPRQSAAPHPPRL